MHFRTATELMNEAAVRVTSTPSCARLRNGISVCSSRLKLQPTMDPQIAEVKKQAVAAIAAGDYGLAEGLLRDAFDADLAIARRAQDVANRHFLSAAKTKANLAELKLTELKYAAALADFREAADLA